MKNLLASILIAFTVSTSSISVASALPAFITEQPESTGAASVILTQKEKSKLDVEVENAINDKLTIRLTDAAGNHIATKIMPAQEMGRTRLRFDLTSLQDGKYLVKVIDGKNVQVKKFALATVVSASANQNLTLL